MYVCSNKHERDQERLREVISHGWMGLAAARVRIILERAAINYEGLTAGAEAMFPDRQHDETGEGDPFILLLERLGDLYGQRFE